METRSLLVGFLAGIAATAAAILLAERDVPAERVVPAPAEASEKTVPESPAAALEPIALERQEPSASVRREEAVREAVGVLTPPSPAPGIPGAWIRGRAAGARGRGLEGAWITAKRWREEGARDTTRTVSIRGMDREVWETCDVARTRAGSGGHFVVYGLQEGEPYDLFVDLDPASFHALSAIREEEVPAARVTAPQDEVAVVIPIGVLHVNASLGSRHFTENVAGVAAARFCVSVRGEGLHLWNWSLKPASFDVVVLTGVPFDLELFVDGKDRFRSEGLVVPQDTGELAVTALVPEPHKATLVEIRVRDGSGRPVTSLEFAEVVTPKDGARCVLRSGVAEKASPEPGLFHLCDSRAGHRQFVIEPTPDLGLARALLVLDSPENGMLRRDVVLDPGGGLRIHVGQSSSVQMLEEFVAAGTSAETWWPPVIVDYTAWQMLDPQLVGNAKEPPAKLYAGRTYLTSTLLPAGRYDLSFRRRDGSTLRRSVVIEAGKTTDLDLCD